jgi:hypothetical protein
MATEAGTELVPVAQSRVTGLTHVDLRGPTCGLRQIFVLRSLIIFHSEISLAAEVSL